MHTMHQRGLHLLLPAILFTVRLGQNHSAKLYHPLQTEQNLMRQSLGSLAPTDTIPEGLGL